MDALFNVDKPRGPTSHDVVARLRRASGVRRIGHAGTLDPLAQGVLLVAVGQATRVIEYLTAADKAYRATVTFGVETATYDAEGEVVATAPTEHLTVERIGTALESFRGTLSQRPPAYSAISVGGKRLYERARRGEVVEVPERTVEISRLELEAWEPPVATLMVECSKGTYIRSLAHDLGGVLGTGAHLSGLVRLRIGDFRLEDATPLETLEGEMRTGTWQRAAIPPDAALAHLPALRLDAASASRVANGIAIEDAMGDGDDGGPEPGAALVRGYGPDGRFLAILRREPPAGGEGRVVFRPEKVFVTGAVAGAAGR